MCSDWPIHWLIDDNDDDDDDDNIINMWVLCVNSPKRAHRAIVRAAKSFISGGTAITGSVTDLLRNFPSSGNTKCKQRFGIFYTCTLFFLSDAMYARQSLAMGWSVIISPGNLVTSVLCWNVQITSANTGIWREGTNILYLFVHHVTLVHSTFDSVSYFNF